MYVIYICWFHSMEITGMLYILPTVVLQVKAYLYYETINKTILSFLDVPLTHCVSLISCAAALAVCFFLFLHGSIKSVTGNREPTGELILHIFQVSSFSGDKSRREPLRVKHKKHWTLKKEMWMRL